MAIVITGGSKGIGRDIALAFAEPGTTIVVNFHSDLEAARATAAEIAGKGAEAVLVQADAGTPEGCRAVAEAVAERGERVGLAVHCAVDALATPAVSADLERFTRAVVTNGVSLLYLVQALDALFDAGASVIFLSSRGGRAVVPHYAAVGVGKAASEAMMRYLAAELAPRGIRLNAVAPSIVDTQAVRTIFGEEADARMAKAAVNNPMGRNVEPADYTELIRYLASPAAAYVTGQVIFLNGGANLTA